jgi:hypothetical protein
MSRRRHGVEVGRRPAPAEQRQAGDDQRPAAAVDEVGVVEVRVHLCGEPGPDDGAEQVAGPVRRRHRPEHRRSEVDSRRPAELRPRAVLGQVRRSGRTRRDVDVAEGRARLGHGRVRVPAAAAEQRRGQAAVAEPCAFPRDALAGLAAGRPGVRRAREVRVMSERPS